MLEARKSNLRTSVVLATRNGARYLEPQLRSLANQSQPPCEIIVTDDDSTDATMSIVSEFSRQSTIPVRLLQNRPALGFEDNFIQGALQELFGIAPRITCIVREPVAGPPVVDDDEDPLSEEEVIARMRAELGASDLPAPEGS